MVEGLRSNANDVRDTEEENGTWKMPLVGSDCHRLTRRDWNAGRYSLEQLTASGSSPRYLPGRACHRSRSLPLRVSNFLCLRKNNVYSRKDRSVQAGTFSQNRQVIAPG